MTVTERLPRTKGRLGVTIAAAAALWWLAFWVNARIWDWLLHDLVGWPPKPG